MITEVTDDLMREAIDRIARTADGEILYRFFQKILCSVSTDANDSALREHNGRRSFAAELMGLMAEGIDGGGRSEHSGRPVVFARRDAGNVKRKLTAREYLASQPDDAGDQRDPGK